MDNIENGFIIDLTNATRISDIIYEISKILDIPEAQNKKVCLKLGDISLNVSELNSIKTLIETMSSEIGFISTTSDETILSASELKICISKLENTIEAPDFVTETKVNPDVEHALDKIFGDNNFEDEEEVKEIEDIKVIEEEEEEDAETLEMRLEAEKLPTLYVKRTIRSGQSVSSDGNLIVIGDVNPGAEVIAKGDITIWGILGGIAHAGSQGNTQTRIRALKLNAIQLRIADIYARRPDGANVPFVQKTNEFMPEEAKIFNKNIIVNRYTENKD